MSPILANALTRQLVPLGMSIAYFLILPPPSAFADLAEPSTSAYTALPGDADGEILDAADVDAKSQTRKLGVAEKVAIARPMVVPYMVPLFVVVRPSPAARAECRSTVPSVRRRGSGVG